jgi:hypothetical protein
MEGNHKRSKTKKFPVILEMAMLKETMTKIDLAAMNSR